MTNIIEHREQRITKIPIPNTDDFIEVSSVHYEIGAMKLNETCVFFPNGESDVRGSYDDHERIVKELKYA